MIYWFVNGNNNLIFHILLVFYVFILKCTKVCYICSNFNYCGYFNTSSYKIFQKLSIYLKTIASWSVIQSPNDIVKMSTNMNKNISKTVLQVDKINKQYLSLITIPNVNNSSKLSSKFKSNNNWTTQKK